MGRIVQLATKNSALEGGLHRIRELLAKSTSGSSSGST
jgi:hypothetical protein